MPTQPTTKKQKPRHALSALKPPPARYTKLSITLAPRLCQEIALRGDVCSGVIGQGLARYYALLREARGRLREQLTPTELSAILDVLNGHWWSEQLCVVEIWATIEDGCRLDGLAQKWNIDGPALIAKIKRLDLVAVHALADACIRFWHRVGHGESGFDPARALD